MTKLTIFYKFDDSENSQIYSSLILPEDMKNEELVPFLKEKLDFAESSLISAFENTKK